MKKLFSFPKASRFCLFHSLFLFTAAGLYAQPQEPSIVSGKVSIEQTNSTALQITATDRSIVNWKSFSIDAGEVSRFVLPSSNAAILNRVVGSEISHLMGTLESNGRVYLINPHGIIVGKGGLINTGGFLASTLDLPDDHFLKQDEWTLTGTTFSSVVNYGTINSQAGDVVLLGFNVKNEGKIHAIQGDIYLGSGQEIVIKPESMPFLSIRPSREEITRGGVENTGTLEALRLNIAKDVNFYALGIKHDDYADALTVVGDGGRIYLVADQGWITSSDTMAASKGVSLEAGTVHILKEAKVFVSEGKISVVTEGLLNQEGKLIAPEGVISLHVKGDSGIFNTGLLDVSGGRGGLIEITAPRYLNSGGLKADQQSGGPGFIRIDVSGPFIETASGSMSANGGNIEVMASRLFSSGTHRVDNIDGRGGEICLLGKEIFLPAAHLHASGKSSGTIYIGKDRDGVEYAETTYLNFATEMKSEKIVISSQKPKEDIPDSFFLAAPEALAFSSSFTLTSGPIVSQTEFIDPREGFGTFFGGTVLTLPSGNVVILKRGDDLFGANSGALYLYDGGTTALLSTLTGSTAGDMTSALVIMLTNGNYVLSSPNWDNPIGPIINAGAVTWGSQVTGVSGVISATNSLVGGTAGDQVGLTGGFVTALPSGNYVVRSALWDNPAFPLITNVGAVTWGNGTTGIVGPITTSNSLVGGSVSDQVGSYAITVLTNGNYVTTTIGWDDPVGPIAGVGAVTWGSGTSAVPVGLVGSGNSLVGSQLGDQVGNGFVFALTNGNYVVSSNVWRNGVAANAGAATWGNGAIGISGAVGAGNSLVGGVSDSIGQVIIGSGIVPLTNGNYVVRSPSWTNPAFPLVTDVGAVTWVNGALGTPVGLVTTANSVYGSTISDMVGNQDVVPLTNGNYVVRSPLWNNGAATTAGAATWGNGATGTSGVVGAGNSLIGGTIADQVSGTGAVGVTALTNGNYVVISIAWDNPAFPLITDVGAVTWVNGALGTPVGLVTTGNSLHGTLATDVVGFHGVTPLPLPGGNYVVRSGVWNNGAALDAGAVTWGSGTGGVSGPVGIGNSLIGAILTDRVALLGVTALSNGNYVVDSPLWDNPVGPVVDVGAVTWGNGATGTSGVVGVGNSLVGTTALDQVGSPGSTALSNGNYVVSSSLWDDPAGPTADVGAATWVNGSVGLIGPVSTANSLHGTTASDRVGDSSGIGVPDVREFGPCYIVISSFWINGAFASAGAATPASSATGLVGPVTPTNSLVGENMTTNLNGNSVFFDTVHNSLIASFTTESGSGRVRLAFLPVIPVTGGGAFVVSARTLSRGLWEFWSALGDVFDGWRFSLNGGVLDENLFAPLGPYKEYPRLRHLIKFPYEDQGDIMIQRKGKK